MRFVYAMLLIAILGSGAEAQWRRGVFRGRFQRNQCHTSSYQHYQQSSMSMGYNTHNGQAYYQQSSVQQTTTSGVTEGDGLAEVNARRARSGLPPYLPDPLLTQGARNVAAWRAARRLFGHAPNDFAFLPPGAHARFGGCAAYEDSYGWMSCGVEDRTARYAGAYWVRGADGRRYMHLFAR